MEIIISEAINTDSEAILSLIRCLKNFESEFDSDYKTNEESVIQLYENIKSHGPIFIAKNKDKLVGFVAVEITNKNDELIVNNIPVVYISDIVVLPEFRNKGIGKQMLQSVELWAKNKGLNYLKLDVFSKNIKAKNIYLDSGFEEYVTTMLKDLNK